jgi:hypothetical protein
MIGGLRGPFFARLAAMVHTSALMRCGCAVAVALAAAGTARADLCERALAVRVNERGLDLVTKLVRPMLPEVIAIPALDEVVLSWPTGDDARLQVPELSAKLKVKDLTTFMDGGSLYIQGSLDVAAATPLTVLNPYVGFGRADCQAALDLKNVELQIGALLDSESGKTRVYVQTAKVHFSEDGTSASLDGCALGSIVSSVGSLFKARVMSAAEKAISSMAKSQIPTLLQSKLDSALQLEAKTEGLAVGVQIAGLSTDATGLSAMISASLASTVTETPSCLAGLQLAPLPTCVAQSPVLGPQVDAMFAAGISEALLQQVLEAVWRGGSLCIDSRAMHDNPLVGPNLDKLGAALGLPGDASIEFQVRLARAPSVRFDALTGISLELTGLRLDLQLTLPGGGDPGRIGVELDGAVSALPWIDPETASLALDLRSLAIKRLNVIGEVGTIGLDPARLQRFVSQVVVPLLQKKLEGEALSPTVVNGKGEFLVDLKRIDVRGGFAAAYVDAFVPSTAAADTEPPKTSLVERPGAVVAPQLLRIVVGGTDNQTPTGLLRYRARVDGGPWAVPRYSRRIDVAVKGGAHVIEIAAVDLSSNTDPNPLAVKVMVDDQSPGLKVATQPDELLRSSSAEVTLITSDDLTPAERIAVQGELYRVPDAGGSPELVGTLPFRTGAQIVRFDDLRNGVYKLRVIARDEAGNVTSRDLGFVVELDSGCTAAPGRPASVPLGLLLLAVGLAAACLARRRPPV